MRGEHTVKNCRCRQSIGQTPELTRLPHGRAHRLICADAFPELRDAVVEMAEANERLAEIPLAEPGELRQSMLDRQQYRGQRRPRRRLSGISALGGDGGTFTFCMRGAAISFR